MHLPHSRVRAESAASLLRKSVGPGGLGLHVSRLVARMLGGAVECESVPGKGTVMRLRLMKVRWFEDQTDFHALSRSSARSGARTAAPGDFDPFTGQLSSQESGPWWPLPTTEEDAPSGASAPLDAAAAPAATTTAAGLVSATATATATAASTKRVLEDSAMQLREWAAAKAEAEAEATAPVPSDTPPKQPGGLNSGAEVCEAASRLEASASASAADATRSAPQLQPLRVLAPAGRPHRNAPDRAPAAAAAAAPSRDLHHPRSASASASSQLSVHFSPDVGGETPEGCDADWSFGVGAGAASPDARRRLRPSRAPTPRWMSGISPIGSAPASLVPECVRGRHRRRTLDGAKDQGEDEGEGVGEGGWSSDEEGDTDSLSGDGNTGNNHTHGAGGGEPSGRPAALAVATAVAGAWQVSGLHGQLGSPSPCSKAGAMWGSLSKDPLRRESCPSNVDSEPPRAKERGGSAASSRLGTLPPAVEEETDEDAFASAAAAAAAVAMLRANSASSVQRPPFHAQLTATASSSSSAGGPAAAAAAAGGGGLSVLVVDDVATNTRLLERAVARGGRATVQIGARCPRGTEVSLSECPAHTEGTAAAPAT